MARPKSATQREPLPMRIEENTMKYMKIKASVLGVNYNSLIEDALIKFLKKTRNMSKMEVYKLILSPLKVKRIPISTTIQGSILDEARELAKKSGGLFAEVVEAAITDTIHKDAEDMRAGKLSKVIEQALKEFLNAEIQYMKTTLPKLEKHLEEAEINIRETY